MGVELGATFDHIGADPYGLTGGGVGSDVVEGHRCGRLICGHYEGPWRILQGPD